MPCGYGTMNHDGTRRASAVRTDAMPEVQQAGAATLALAAVLFGRVPGRLVAD